MYKYAYINKRKACADDNTKYPMTKNVELKLCIHTPHNEKNVDKLKLCIHTPHNEKNVEKLKLYTQHQINKLNLFEFL